MTDMTPMERADLARQLLSNPGWLKLLEPALLEKLAQAKDQAMLVPGDPGALPEYKGWSTDRFAGMAMGLGWAQKVIPIWLAKYDAEQRALQSTPEAPPEPSGHPYGPRETANMLPDD